MAKISEIEVPSLLLDEQASDPATPASGFGRLYAKADGLYFIDSAGSAIGPFGAGGGVALAGSSVEGSAGGDVTTTSTTLVDLTGASITVSTGAHRVKIGFSCIALASAANATLSFGVMVDGTDQGGSIGQVRSQDSVANLAHAIGFVYMTPAALAAGSHTFKIRWACSSGTGSVKNISSGIWQMWVEECPF